MRETTFIEQKKKNWAKFEKMQRVKDSDPDEMTRLFVEITDDLSFSRTFYQKRSVRVYLNYLAQMVFLNVTKKKKLKLSKFFRFWTYSLPMEFARSWKSMILSLLIFVGSIMIGIISSQKDPDFARQILGDEYVEMTNRNIAKGDPMAVYHSNGSSLSSSLSLTLHNTQISALTYTSGLFTGLPTASILVQNGIMVGTFHHFLYEKDVLGEGIFIIWIHGVLELSAIVIAGGAGFVLGLGFLFPGSYTRLQAFRITAKRSFKIALSTIFILIISGFIEGSVTRYTQMPFVIKGLIIFVSFGFILGYFVLYPMYLYRKYIKGQGLKFEDKIPHVKEDEFELYKVREVGELYSDSLLVLRNLFGNFMKGFFLFTFPFVSAVAFYFFFFVSDAKLELNWIFNLQDVLFNSEKSLLGWMALIVMFSSLMINAYYALDLFKQKQEFNISTFFKYLGTGFLKTWPLLIFLTGAYFWQSKLLYLLFVVLSPFIFHLSYAGFMEGKDYRTRFISIKRVFWRSWIGTVGFGLLLIAMPLILMVAGYQFFGDQGLQIIAIPLEFIQHNISPLVKDPTPYFNVINFMLYMIFTAIIFLFLVCGMVVQIHSVKERWEAVNLYKRLKEFGTKNKLFEQIGEGEY